MFVFNKITKTTILFDSYEEAEILKLIDNSYRDTIFGFANELTSISESLLFATARAQLISEKIIPAIENGEFVICDRFTDSTIAYQGYGRGLNIKQLEEINYIATTGLTPDITFILDISLDTATVRMEAEASDRMEETGVDFFRRIRGGYRQIKDQNMYRYRLIDGEQSPENVFKEIKEIIMKQFEEALICS